MITVLMSIYKEPEAWLKESIDSILNQTFSDFEFIIVNDCPDRELNDSLIKEYVTKDRRIVYLRNDKNLGLTKSLNKGLRVAKGKYIFRHDADDISVMQRLEVQYRYMENNPEVIVCGSNMYNFVDMETKRLVKFPEKNDEIKLMFLFKNALAHPTVVLRRSFFAEKGIQYDESSDADFCEDMFLWISIMNEVQFHNIQKPLVFRRESEVQITKSKAEITNAKMMVAAKKHLDSIDEKLLSTFRNKNIHKAATVFHKNRVRLIDLITLFFEGYMFLYPKYFYYTLRKQKYI